jgi:hypothetical protein
LEPELVIERKVTMRCVFADGQVAVLDAKDGRARMFITINTNSPAAALPGYTFQEGNSVNLTFEIASGRN